MDYHLPVMLNECIEGLNIRLDGTYVDATFGVADIRVLSCRIWVKAAGL